MEIERKLAELGIEVPAPPVPAAHYIPYVRVGNLLFVGGNTGGSMVNRTYMPAKSAIT